jgi:hypothetical protein
MNKESRRRARFKIAQQSRACYIVRVMRGVAEFIFGLCFFRCRLSFIVASTAAVIAQGQRFHGIVVVVGSGFLEVVYICIGRR